MKKKPDILVVLAAILGLGIAVSSVSVASPDDQRPTKLQVAQSNQ
ncbi:MAG: hypothetical protein V2I33_03155 [Kangiellaceae bacterium]|jgi:hypothetical protein|nr:hypothetical protein [Kangiellaceae bacterium]